MGVSRWKTKANESMMTSVGLRNVMRSLTISPIVMMSTPVAWSKRKSSSRCDDAVQIEMAAKSRRHSSSTVHGHSSSGLIRETGRSCAV